MTKTGIDALCEGIRDLTEERDRLREALAAALEEIERQTGRADGNFKSYERVKAGFSEAEQRIKELEKALSAAYERAAKEVERIYDLRLGGARQGEQCIRTAAAIRALLEEKP